MINISANHSVHELLATRKRQLLDVIARHLREKIFKRDKKSANNLFLVIKKLLLLEKFSGDRNNLEKIKNLRKVCKLIINLDLEKNPKGSMKILGWICGVIKRDKITARIKLNQYLQEKIDSHKRKLKLVFAQLKISSQKLYIPENTFREINEMAALAVYAGYDQSKNFFNAYEAKLRKLNSGNFSEETLTAFCKVCLSLEISIVNTELVEFLNYPEGNHQYLCNEIYRCAKNKLINKLNKNIDKSYKIIARHVNACTIINNRALFVELNESRQLLEILGEERLVGLLLEFEHRCQQILVASKNPTEDSVNDLLLILAKISFCIDSPGAGQGINQCFRIIDLDRYIECHIGSPSVTSRLQMLPGYLEADLFKAELETYAGRIIEFTGSCRHKGHCHVTHDLVITFYKLLLNSEILGLSSFTAAVEYSYSMILLRWNRQIELNVSLMEILAQFSCVLSMLLATDRYSDGQFHYKLLRLLSLVVREFTSDQEATANRSRSILIDDSHASAGRLSLISIPLYLARNITLLTGVKKEWFDSYESLAGLIDKMTIELKFLERGSAALMVYRIEELCSGLLEVYSELLLFANMQKSFPGNLLWEGHILLIKMLNQAAAWQEVESGTKLISSLYAWLETGDREMEFPGVNMISLAKRNESIKIILQGMVKDFRAMNFASDEGSTFAQCVLGRIDLLQALVQEQQVENNIVKEEFNELTSVSFARVIPEIKRFLKQINATLGKQAHVSFSNELQLFERETLSSLLSSIKHLLRYVLINAVETVEERRRAGKSSVPSIIIDLCVKKDVVELRLRDDGRGCDLSEKNLLSLFKKIGQQFSYNCSPGQGSSYVLAYPKPEAPVQNAG